MLYAYINQKGHVDELIHAFTKFAPNLDMVHGATIVDIGCGPFTAGLALANVVGNGAAFRYFGVDRAASMCEFGSELAQEVRALGEMNLKTQVSFHGSVDEIDFGARRAGEVTVFVLSYLLASSSLDVEALVNEISAARERIGWGPAVILYTNSAKDGPRAQFPAFKKRLEDAGFPMLIEEEERFAEADKPRDIHYALFSRPAVANLPISEFFK
ncbi:hypothetical protein [Variovorax sp. E3]|uniref:hypothetical protein n=1 Tax=Variovorax sp. E3 TaxID=1914993 RepID=UPI0018DDBA90|nr:hypothetical protein [Variovorax sp. E3]